MAKRRTRLWLLPVMLAAAGFCYLDNCTVQTTFRTLRCATLPEAFSGLRIVQISDLHGRVFGKEHAALLDAVRAAKPDFIAITGDLADEDTALPSLRPLLAGLTALAPVYYVTGNHEWVISRAVRQTLCDLLDGYGVIRLENDYRVLERDGQRLVIAGVDDPNGPADQKTAPELVREIRSAYGEDVFILALCHRNDQLPLWAGLDVPVVLAGPRTRRHCPTAGTRRRVRHALRVLPRRRRRTLCAGRNAALRQPRPRPQPKIADPRLQCTGAAGADARARGDINFF